MFTLYNAVSADGFIAREDGSEDFIPEEAWQYFLNRCKEYGTIVLGRKAYEALQNYDQDELRQFESLDVRKIVISANAGFKVKSGYILTHSPEEALWLAPDALVSSGPTLNDSLIEKGMVREIMRLRLPQSIGTGVKAFTASSGSIPIATKHL